VPDFYGDLAVTISGLLADKSQATMYLVKSEDSNTSAPYDLSDPTEYIYDFDGVAFAVDAKMVDGTLIQAGDLKVYANIGGETPETGDFWEIGETRYTIVDARQIPAAGTPVVNELIIRR
jgi:hypothetical protein